MQNNLTNKDFEGFASELGKNLSALFSKTQHAYDSCRLFHGRGKAFPPIDWCAVDYFEGTILATIYWLEDESVEGLFLDALSIKLKPYLNDNLITCVVIQRRDQAGAPFRAIHGEMPKRSIARRGDLVFPINFDQQNIGYFLDIEAARRWLEKKAPHARILNLFSYTCTFSVIAQASGAESVVNIDLSKKSLVRGKENHKSNQLPLENIHFFAHDIFKSWGKLKKYGPYDIAIIDPPSFQKGSFIARKDYVKVLGKMSVLLDKGAYFLACLNAPEITCDEFKAWIDSSCEEFEFSESLCAGESFPEVEEGRGLKMLVYKKIS